LGERKRENREREKRVKVGLLFLFEIRQTVQRQRDRQTNNTVTDSHSHESLPQPYTRVKSQMAKGDKEKKATAVKGDDGKVERENTFSSLLYLTSSSSLCLSPIFVTVRSKHFHIFIQPVKQFSGI
jgi:hypothetical protein